MYHLMFLGVRPSFSIVMDSTCFIKAVFHDQQPLLTSHSLFWYQINRQKLRAPVSWLTYSLLRLRKDSVSGRYLFRFLVFLISHFQHAVIDITSGIPWSKSGAIRFFAVGLLLEATAQESWTASWWQAGGKIGEAYKISSGILISHVVDSGMDLSCYDD